MEKADDKFRAVFDPRNREIVKRTTPHTKQNRLHGEAGGEAGAEADGEDAAVAVRLLRDNKGNLPPN